MTKTSTNITLNQMYIAFSFFFSVRYLGEKSSIKKLVSISLTLLGIAIVGVQSQRDSSANAADVEESDSPMGILIISLSAFLYSVVQLYYGLKVLPHIVEPTSFHVFMYSGFQGLFSFCVLLPVGCYIWHVTGFEPFEFPPPEAALTLLINGICFVFYVPLLLFALQWTNPSFVGVGCAMTIPMSICTDLIFHDIAPSLVQTIGSVVTLAGVVLYSLLLKQDASS
jgi:drug/metabolite transporter (DMT)-like permease